MHMTTKNNKERSRRQEDNDSKALALPSLGFPRIFEEFEVEVKVTSNEHELKAEKNSQKESKGKNGTQSMSTRAYFQRSLSLPEEVVSEKVVGTMKNGVLELKLPKKDPKAHEVSRRVALK